MGKKVFNIPGRVQVPLSDAVRAGDFIFVAGQGVFRDPETGEKIDGIEAQTRAAIERMKRVLEKAGASLDNVVKNTVYLTNVSDFDKMNEVYASYFPKEPPARKSLFTVPHEGPKLLFEIDCIAYHPQ